MQIEVTPPDTWDQVQLPLLAISRRYVGDEILSALRYGADMRIFVIALILFAATVLAEPTTLTGTVTKVRDGDTIEVGRIPIRLNGVSAPEMNEPLGPQSKAFMTDLVMGRWLRCELNGDRTHDRLVGTCYLDGKDIGAKVIANGLALDCPRYSAGRYSEYEIKGAAAKMKLPGYCF